MVLVSTPPAPAVALAGAAATGTVGQESLALLPGTTRQQAQYTVRAWPPCVCVLKSTRKTLRVDSVCDAELFCMCMCVCVVPISRTERIFYHASGLPTALTQPTHAFPLLLRTCTCLTASPGLAARACAAPAQQGL